MCYNNFFFLFRWCIVHKNIVFLIKKLILNKLYSNFKLKKMHINKWVIKMGNFYFYYVTKYIKKIYLLILKN